MSASDTNKPSEGIVGQIGNSTSNAANYISKASTDNAKAAAKRAKMKEKNNRNRKKRREKEKLERKNAKKQARLSPAQDEEDGVNDQHMAQTQLATKGEAGMAEDRAGKDLVNN